MRESSKGPSPPSTVKRPHGREHPAQLAELSREAVAVLAGLIAAKGSPAHAYACSLAANVISDWPLLVDHLAAHEMAPLARRRAAELGLAVPHDAEAALLTLALAASQRTRRSQFTLYRFLHEAAARQLPTILLKGTSLVGRAYDVAAERHMIDVDVLVPASQVARACGVARAIGLGPGRYALPLMFHRLVHFEFSMQPWLDGMVPVDLHWRLHSAASLLTVDVAALWARRRPCVVHGEATARLDASDEWLHLITHVFRHWGAVPTGIGAEDIEGLLRDRSGAVHVKWLRDLVVATERLLPTVACAELADRAVEWSAAPQVAAALALIESLLSPEVAVRARLLDCALQPRCGTPMVRRLAGRAAPVRQGDVVLPLLGFRLASLRHLRRWLWPPRAHLQVAVQRRHGRVAARGDLSKARVRHGAAVLQRLVAAAFVLPFALVALVVLAPMRAAARRRARRADHVFQLVRSRVEFDALAAMEP